MVALLGGAVSYERVIPVPGGRIISQLWWAISQLRCGSSLFVAYRFYLVYRQVF